MAALAGLTIDGGVSVLAGAGISRPAPTEFPIALELIDAIAEVALPGDGVASTVRELFQRARPDQRSACDYIRFETLVQVIEETVDPELELLESLALFTQVGPLHLLLADAAQRGATVMTTNFDDLLERAVQSSGGTPETVDVFPAGPNSPDRVPIWKLHGTLRRWSSGQVDAGRSAQASISRISANAPPLGLQADKMRCLQDLTDDTTMIVVGYSGADDLDLVPSLYELTPRRLIWIDHRDGRPARDVTADIDDLVRSTTIGGLSPRDELFGWMRRHRPGVLEVWEGATGPAVAEILGRTLPIVAGGPPPDWRRALRSWASDRRVTRSKQLLIAARLFDLLDRPEQALACLEHSRTGPELAHHRRWLLSKAAEGVHDLRSADRFLGRDLVTSARSADAPSKLAGCIHRRGYIRYLRGDLDAAVEWYDVGLDVARRTGDRVVEAQIIHDAGLLALDRGAHVQAEELFQRSLALSNESGDFKHMMFTLHQLGVLEYDRGDLDAARRRHTLSRRGAEMIGSLSHVSMATHELGMVALAAGDVVEAARSAALAIRLDRQGRRPRWMPLYLELLGRALLEVGDARRAMRWFDRSERAIHDGGDGFWRGNLLAHRAFASMLIGRSDAVALAEEAVAVAGDEPSIRARASSALYLVQAVGGAPGALGRLGRELDAAHRGGHHFVVSDGCSALAFAGLSRSAVPPPVWSAAESLARRTGNGRRLDLLAGRAGGPPGPS